MHDGESPTLIDDVRRHRIVASIQGLSDTDMADIVAFISALTDQRFITDPQFALPMRACGKKL